MPLLKLGISLHVLLTLVMEKTSERNAHSDLLAFRNVCIYLHEMYNNPNLNTALLPDIKLLKAKTCLTYGLSFKSSPYVPIVPKHGF